MTSYTLDFHPSEGGHVCFYSLPDQQGPSDRPLVVFVHGAMRNSENLDYWGPLLKDQFDVVFVDLPNHGRSTALRPPNVETFGRIIGDALHARFPDRRILMVGESLGGLVSLRIAGREDPGPVKAVLAIDPPMTTAKLWQVEKSLRGHLAQYPQNELAREFVAEVFGFVEGGNEERIYYPLVGAVRLPAKIATGDMPLMPARPLKVVACMFDEVDRFVIEQHYADKVEVRRLPGRHHLLLYNDRENCKALIEEMVGLYLEAPARA